MEVKPSQRRPSAGRLIGLATMTLSLSLGPSTEPGNWPFNIGRARRRRQRREIWSLLTIFMSMILGDFVKASEKKQRKEKKTALDTLQNVCSSSRKFLDKSLVDATSRLQRDSERLLEMR